MQRTTSDMRLANIATAKQQQYPKVNNNCLSYWLSHVYGRRHVALLAWLKTMIWICRQRKHIWTVIIK